MRRTAGLMGTVASIDIPDAGEPVFSQVFSLLRAIDERFSTYKPDSEVSRYARGVLAKSRLSPELREVIDACVRLEKETRGYFSAHYAKTFDPSGYVKGWAIKRAGELIGGAGYDSYCVGIGGDILAASDGKKEWRIGIQHPAKRNEVLYALDIKNSAVATSGNYERGAHIKDPQTGRDADYWQSVSVIGPQIDRADVLATAAAAMGRSGLEFLASTGYDYLLIDGAGKQFMSLGLKKLLV